MLEEIYNSIENLSARIKSNKSARVRSAARGPCQSRRAGPLGRFVSCNKCHLSNSSRIYKICWIKLSVTHGQGSPWKTDTTSENINMRSSQKIGGLATVVHGTNVQSDKSLMTILTTKTKIFLNICPRGQKYKWQRNKSFWIYSKKYQITN